MCVLSINLLSRRQSRQLSFSMHPTSRHATCDHLATLSEERASESPSKQNGNGSCKKASASDAGMEDLGAVLAMLGDGRPDVACLLACLISAGHDDAAFAQRASELVAFASATPYFDLPGYMDRLWLRPVEAGAPFAARLHHILRSDHDRALHDHPWPNASFVLSGGYWEVVPGLFQAAVEWMHGGRTSGGIDIGPEPAQLVTEVAVFNVQIQHGGPDVMQPQQIGRLQELGVVWRAPKSYTPRRAESLHRLIVPHGRSAWSLFVMAPKVREWGFLSVDGWIHNVPYIKALGREA
jgi:hypothetical protein